LVAVKVVDLLAPFSVFVDPVAFLRQGVVGIRVGIDIGIPVVRVNFLQQMAAVSDKSGFLFEVTWNFFVFQTISKRYWGRL